MGGYDKADGDAYLSGEAMTRTGPILLIALIMAVVVPVLDWMGWL